VDIFYITLGNDKIDPNISITSSTRSKRKLENNDINSNNAVSENHNDGNCDDVKSSNSDIINLSKKQILQNRREKKIVKKEKRKQTIKEERAKLNNTEICTDPSVWRVNDLVDVLDDNKVYCPAIIIRIKPRIKCSFIGWSEEWDEEIQNPMQRIFPSGQYVKQYKSWVLINPARPCLYWPCILYMRIPENGNKDAVNYLKNESQGNVILCMLYEMCELSIYILYMYNVYDVIIVYVIPFNSNCKHVKLYKNGLWIPTSQVQPYHTEDMEFIQNMYKIVNKSTYKNDFQEAVEEANVYRHKDMFDVLFQFNYNGSYNMLPPNSEKDYLVFMNTILTISVLYDNGERGTINTEDDGVDFGRNNNASNNHNELDYLCVMKVKCSQRCFKLMYEIHLIIRSLHIKGDIDSDGVADHKKHSTSIVNGGDDGHIVGNKKWYNFTVVNSDIQLTPNKTFYELGITNDVTIVVSCSKSILLS
jgi:hypothetical protein